MSEWLVKDWLEYEEMKQLRKMSDKEFKEFERKRDILISKGEYDDEKMLPYDVLAMNL